MKKIANIHEAKTNETNTKNVRQKLEGMSKKIGNTMINVGENNESKVSEIGKKLYTHIDEMAEDTLMQKRNVEYAENKILKSLKSLYTHSSFQEYQNEQDKPIFLEAVKEFLDTLLSGELENIIFRNYIHLEVQELLDIPRNSAKTGNGRDLAEVTKTFFLEKVPLICEQILGKEVPHDVVDKVIKIFYEDIRNNTQLGISKETGKILENDYLRVWKNMDHTMNSLVNPNSNDTDRKIASLKAVLLKIKHSA